MTLSQSLEDGYGVQMDEKRLVDDERSNALTKPACSASRPKLACLLFAFLGLSFLYSPYFELLQGIGSSSKVSGPSFWSRALRC